MFDWQSLMGNMLSSKQGISIGGDAGGVSPEVESPNPASAHQPQGQGQGGIQAMLEALNSSKPQQQQTPAVGQQAPQQFAPNHYNGGYNPRVEQGRNFTDVYFDAKDKADKSFFEAFGKFLGGIIGS